MKLQLALMSPGTEPTRLLEEPTLDQYASRPRPLLYIGIGVVMGLMLGLIGAVVAEFWAKTRREMAARSILAGK